MVSPTVRGGGCIGTSRVFQRLNVNSTRPMYASVSATTSGIANHSASVVQRGVPAPADVVGAKHQGDDGEELPEQLAAGRMRHGLGRAAVLEAIEIETRQSVPFPITCGAPGAAGSGRAAAVAHLVEGGLDQRQPHAASGRPPGRWGRTGTWSAGGPSSRPPGIARPGPTGRSPAPRRALARAAAPRAAVAAEAVLHDVGQRLGQRQLDRVALAVAEPAGSSARNCWWPAPPPHQRGLDDELGGGHAASPPRRARAAWRSGSMANTLSMRVSLDGLRRRRGTADGQRALAAQRLQDRRQGAEAVGVQEVDPPRSITSGRSPGLDQVAPPVP